MFKKICKICKTIFIIPYKSWLYKETCSRVCGYKFRVIPSNSGQFTHESSNQEKNSQWKGNAVGYTALHDWVRRHKGTPSLCELCGAIKAPRFEWANKSKKYLRNLDDWIRLCSKCHKVFDKL